MQIKATPYSNLKIFHHAELMKKIENNERISPIYIRIKPTNLCNENCYYCHYKNSYLTLDDYRPDDYIPQNIMMEIIEDMKQLGVKAVTFSGGGEPLMYPYINEAMRNIIEAKIDLSIITNGLKLYGESSEILSHAKWVRLSIDSSEKNLYSKIRGVSLDSFSKLCNNIGEFAKIKDEHCELGVNFVVTGDNYKQIIDMAVLMKSLGVDHIKYAPLINNETEKYHEAFKDQVMSDIQYAKTLETEHFHIVDLYTNDFNRVQNGNMIFDRAYKKCYIKEFICVIAANAKVYYCHDKAYLKNGLVGDLKNHRFKELWFSDEVTKKFKAFDAQEICREHCVYDDRNIMLNQYFSINNDHINFL